VPAGFTEKITDYMLCMRGTDRQPSRCAALGGTVGVSVKCRIY
jgi:hypothetical protein